MARVKAELEGKKSYLAGAQAFFKSYAQIPLSWNRTGPHPHPAAHSILSWGGRVGMGAGANQTENALAR